jgi:hypothetical protein
MLICLPIFEGEKDKEGERIRDVLAVHLSLLSRNR